MALNTQVVLVFLPGTTYVSIPSTKVTGTVSKASITSMPSTKSPSSNASGISETYLIPVLETLLAAFSFVILGFHADNGSEYINPGR